MLTLAQPTAEFAAGVQAAEGEQAAALDDFVVVARSIAKLTTQRTDVLEQQMGDAADAVNDASNRIESLLARVCPCRRTDVGT